jgi:hypothetical protein
LRTNGAKANFTEGNASFGGNGQHGTLIFS